MNRTQVTNLQNKDQNLFHRRACVQEMKVISIYFDLPRTADMRNLGKEGKRK